MIYVFDTNTLIVIGHYYPERFPSFWKMLDNHVGKELIIAVREVYNELDNQSTKKHLADWIKKHRKIFLEPSPEEMQFVSKIFGVSHFQFLVQQKQILKDRKLDWNSLL